jgi:hypothetical protein
MHLCVRATALTCLAKVLVGKILDCVECPSARLLRQLLINVFEKRILKTLEPALATVLVAGWGIAHNAGTRALL